MLALLAGIGAQPGVAQTVDVDEDPWFSLHAQATYAIQWKNNFNGPKPGPASLLSQAQGDVGKSYTLTVTPYIGVRLWPGAQAYYNPEGSQGIPFSHLQGMGGFSNGELQKGASVPMIVYHARAFVRQTIGMGGDTVHLDDAPNQLAATVDRRRWVLTAGWLSALDLFDGNRYSHDPRTQFMNWSIMAGGAYDYAADARGYTYGYAAEYFDGDWAARAGRFAMPRQPNGLELDYQLARQYGDQLEVERAYQLTGRGGKLRVLAFHNRGWLASYREALALAGSAVPSLEAARNAYRDKWGYLLNLEQEIADDVGVFARWSWNNGAVETQAFADIDRSLSGGVVIGGGRWGRAHDNAGVGIALNGISGAHAAFLAQGGQTMFLGDGWLRNSAERIAELYYTVGIVAERLQLTADYQYAQHPGYNAERGPVHFFGLRAHAEF